MPSRSSQQIRTFTHEKRKAGGLLPQKNLSCLALHTFRDFLSAVSRQLESVSRKGAEPHIVVGAVSENATTGCGKFRE